MIDDIRLRRVCATEQEFVGHQMLVASQNGLTGKEKIVGGKSYFGRYICEHEKNP
ncbi:hypothetical protein LP420_34790 [Massilia sp. B-10]|nr:hypothetical protein LP420_34790 [Massilia sp. B-10]